MVSKDLLRSRKIPSIFSLALKEAVILLNKRVQAWLVECFFLRPN